MLLENKANICFKDCRPNFYSVEILVTSKFWSLSADLFFTDKVHQKIRELSLFYIKDEKRTQKHKNI